MLVGKALFTEKCFNFRLIYPSLTYFLIFLDHCVTTQKSLLDLLPTPDSSIRQSDVPLSGESPEVDVVVTQAISRDHNNLMSVADSLYHQANEKLVGLLLISCIP